MNSPVCVMKMWSEAANKYMRVSNIVMPKTQQATTAEQTKFVVQWLAKEENRLACFGGAGAKAAYGGKSVTKPSTAYNALAQLVNAKFGTSWDGESAKSRVRTMKTKFHNVFTLCGGRVQEETDSWKLTDADKAAGILTLADKAQSMCPNWNSWLEWCGNDPNLLKHGSGDSQLLRDISQVDDGLEIDSSSEGEGTDVVDGEGYETYAALKCNSNNKGK